MFSVACAINLQMKNVMDYHVVVLLKEFQARKAKSSLYSMRAFARDIGVHPSSLSQILKSNRKIPHETAVKIVKKLKLSPSVALDFLESNKGRGLLDKVELSEVDERFLLDEDMFTVISEYEHYVVLTLLDIVGFQGSAEEVSEKMEISVTRANEVIENLIAAGLVKKVGDRLEKVYSNVRTSTDVFSKALQASHLEALEMAKSKILTVPLSLRDFTEVTITVSQEMLPELKEAIREFRHKAQSIVSKGNQTDVYKLAIQLYPMTKIKGET